MKEIVQVVVEHSEHKVFVGLPTVGKEDIIEELALATDDWVSFLVPPPPSLPLSPPPPPPPSLSLSPPPTLQ